MNSVRHNAELLDTFKLLAAQSVVNASLVFAHYCDQLTVAERVIALDILTSAAAAKGSKCVST